MIRACSVCSVRVKFNIDLILSEMRRIYRIKFINAYIQREKESGRVNKKNYENSKLIKQILVVYLSQNIFTRCIKFWICEILMEQLKLLSTFFIFAIKTKLLKDYQKCFLIKNVPFVLDIFRVLYFTLPCFVRSLAIAVLSKKLADDKY